MADYPIAKPRDYIAQCWHENLAGGRLTVLVCHEGHFVGWGHLLTVSAYAYFRHHGIPEIQDLDVLPPFRRQGVGSQLLDVLEAEAFEDHGVVGIGFGLYADYGPTQRLYEMRGYIPDGRGVMYAGQPVAPGSAVVWTTISCCSSPRQKRRTHPVTIAWHSPRKGWPKIAPAAAKDRIPGRNPAGP